MTNQVNQAFEKWLKENYPDYPPPLSEVWQAAQQQSDGEITDLKNSLQKIVEVLAAGADLNESYRKTIAEYEKAHKAALEGKSQAMHDEELAYKHYHELKADNERLREAGQALVDRWNTPKWKDAEHTAKFIHALEKALSSTPAQSLAEHEIIKSQRDKLLSSLKLALIEMMALPRSLGLEITHAIDMEILINEVEKSK